MNMEERKQGKNVVKNMSKIGMFHGRKHGFDRIEKGDILHEKEREGSRGTHYGGRRLHCLNRSGIWTMIA